MSWFELWLILHILAAIVAFGPTFVFPIVGPMIKTHPQHAVFGFEVFDVIEKRLVVPFALTMPLSGIGLIRTANVDFAHSTWLTTALGLYVVAMLLALGVQVPGTMRLLTLLREAGPGQPPAPEAMRIITRSRVVGMMLTVLLLAIIVLMITRPGASFG